MHTIKVAALSQEKGKTDGKNTSEGIAFRTEYHKLHWYFSVLLSNWLVVIKCGPHKHLTSKASSTYSEGAINYNQRERNFFLNQVVTSEPKSPTPESERLISVSSSTMMPG